MPKVLWVQLSKGKWCRCLCSLTRKKKFQKAWLHKDLDHSQRKSVMWFGGAIFASTHQWFSVLLQFPLPRLSHFHPSFWVRDWRITVAAELIGVAEITRIKPLTGERTDRMWCMQPPSPAEATLTVQVWGSACSIRSRSRVRGRLQPFVSTLSCYHLAFISWVSSSSPLSSSLCSIAHSTWRTPQPPPPQKPSRAWILILFRGQVAGVQKVTMIEITFAITDHQGRVWLQSRIGLLFRTNW